MAAPFVDVPSGSGFGLDNLPWGCFERSTPGAAGGGNDGDVGACVGVRLGDHVVDASALQRAGYLRDLPGPGPRSAGQSCFQHGRLNDFMAMGRPAWRAAREALQRLLSGRDGELRDNPGLLRTVLVPEADVRMLLPAAIGDYTDFYASRQHATNVGTMFRGAAAALQPNWLHLPVGYHGRSSSIIPSGCDVRRPRGQILPPATAGGAGGAPGQVPPVFGPSTQVDFELEVAALVGPGNALGEPIPVSSGWDHVFGLVLMNDWSARDIQRWEYVPLGPFNGKNWATQVSPWVVTLEALEPFKCAAPPQDDPRVLPYLQEPPGARHTYDLRLAVDIVAAPPTGGGQQQQQQQGGGGAAAPFASTVTSSNLKHL